jgi:hypothetical protein
MLHNAFEAKDIVRASVYPLKGCVRGSQRTIDEEAQRESMAVRCLNNGLVQLVAHLDEAIIGPVIPIRNERREAHGRMGGSNH